MLKCQWVPAPLLQEMDKPQSCVESPAMKLRHKHALMMQQQQLHSQEMTLISNLCFSFFSTDVCPSLLSGAQPCARTGNG